MEDGILSTCRKSLEDWSIASCKGEYNNDTSNIILEVDPADNDGSMMFDFDKLWESYNTIRFASTHETYSQQFDVDHLVMSAKEEGRSAMIKEELAWELEKGRSIDAKALHKAQLVYEEYEEWLCGMFFDESTSGEETETNRHSSYDVLALPSAQVWPFPIEDRYPKVIDGTQMDTYHRWMEVCVPVSFGGLPCVTIPAGFGKSSNNHSGRFMSPLPIGIQLFGKKGDDLKLLRLANEYYHHSCRAAVPQSNQ